MKGTARLHERAGIVLMEALDLAEAEPDGMGGADVRFLPGIGRVKAGASLSPWGEGFADLASQGA